MRIIDLIYQEEQVLIESQRNFGFWKKQKERYNSDNRSCLRS